MEQELVPIRRRAEELRNEPERVAELLADGGAHCRKLANVTMRDVRERMGFD
jgi:tryptophanyl-tRNA synthetase